LTKLQTKLSWILFYDSRRSNVSACLTPFPRKFYVTTYRARDLEITSLSISQLKLQATCALRFTCKHVIVNRPAISPRYGSQKQ